jgi:hypothetical protein
LPESFSDTQGGGELFYKCVHEGADHLSVMGQNYDLRQAVGRIFPQQAPIIRMLIPRRRDTMRKPTFLVISILMVLG